MQRDFHLQYQRPAGWESLSSPFYLSFYLRKRNDKITTTKKTFFFFGGKGGGCFVTEAVLIKKLIINEKKKKLGTYRQHIEVWILRRTLLCGATVSNKQTGI